MLALADVAGALLAAAALVLRRRRAPAPPASDGRGWLGEELPLPLAVRTAQDLAVKAAAEKQYLIFNLLAGGKLAWDEGDFATAAGKWEALLRVHGLDPEIEKVIRPLAKEARARAGGQADHALPPAGAARPPPEPPAAVLPPPNAIGARAPTSSGSVSGTVSGGGALGPGGAVIWLKRVGGETPRPAPAHGKVVTQRNKAFIPHVLVGPGRNQGQLPQRGSDLPQRLLAVEAERLRHRPLQAGRDVQQTFKRAGRRPDSVQHPLVDVGRHRRRRHAVLRAGRRLGRVHDQGRAAGRLRADGLARGGVEADRAAAQRRRRRRRAACRCRWAATSGRRSSSPTSRASRASPTSGIDGCHEDRAVAAAIRISRDRGGWLVSADCRVCGRRALERPLLSGEPHAVRTAWSRF